MNGPAAIKANSTLRQVHPGEGRSLDEETRQRALERARRFVDTASIGYVVIDTAHASSSLIEFAIEAFDLEKIDEEDTVQLYQPVSMRESR